MQAVSTIFDWLVISTVTGSIVVLLILGVKYVFKNTLGANWHYYLWFLLLLKLIVPFNPESPVSIYNIVNLESLGFVGDSNLGSTEITKLPMETGDYVSRLASSTVPADLNPESVKTEFEIDKWKSALIILWLIGAALLVGYTLLINLKLCYQLRTEPNIKNASIIHIIECCKSEMKITRDFPAIGTNKIRTPALFGLINSSLLLPQDLIDNLDENELKYIVLHELAHYKRKDILVNWVAVIAQIIHWFNPIVWYGLYRMHLDCELACDALVLSSLEPQKYREYGNAIIRVLEIKLSPQWIPGISQMLTPKSNIKRRFAMISSFKKESLGIRIITVIVFIAIGMIGCTAAQDTDLDTSNNRNEQSSQLLTDLKTNQMMAGTVDVEGQGVVMTLTDGDSDVYCRVHDSDILLITNELMLAGAEAISVNDERLINSSGIVIRGTHITVNGKQCNGPFVIKAIGNSERMVNALNKQGSYAKSLEVLGIGIKIEQSENLTIPKYNGKVDFEYAKPVENKKNKI